MTKKNQDSSRQSLTSTDVARRAGVSRTAVSYVLNGIDTKNVSAETRAKVLQAAQELGYTMHTSARALRKGHTDEICYILRLPFDAHRVDSLVSLQQYAFDHGYSLTMYFNDGKSPTKVRELLTQVFARRPRGIIASGYLMTEEYINLARSMGVEDIVLFSIRPVDYAPSIVLPLFETGLLAAQHLLERGHHRIGLICPDNQRHIYGFEQRLAGMQSILNQNQNVTLDILTFGFTLNDAHAFVDTFLSYAERATGIYAFNDEYALLLMGALIDRGQQIPGDVAIVGTDNIVFGEYMRPTLTTIRFDSISFGQRAIDMLVAMHNNAPLPEELLHPLQPQLIARGST